MKKVINGKMYNTDTAELLGEYSNSEYGFNHVYEGLYVTKNGTYFLHGEGGPNTYYGRYATCRNIELLSVEEAKKWAETHLDADEYIEAFGEIEEG